MIIRPKDAAKLLGILIMCACATLVCTMFLNSNMDLARIKEQITTPSASLLYDITVSSANVTCAVTGGALGMTTVIMLFFYVKHYIDTHKSELGVLKALGYSNFQIARSFWVFGLSVLVGTSAGFCLSFALMPAFYRSMRSGGALPDVPLHFNPILLVYLVILPALVFSLLAILYGCHKLRRPALELIRGRGGDKLRRAKKSDKQDKEQSFLQDLRRSVVRSRFSLVFFIGLAAFCYAATVVMSFSISEVGGSDMMAVMMAGIGIVLAITTLFIAVATLVKGNAKNIAMLRVFGYADRECARAVLGGYRPITYVGFALGTAYQHGLMKMMMSLFFDNEVMGLPDYNFDVRAFLIALLSFVAMYEIFMRVYAARIRRVSLKEIMQEE